MSFTKSEKKLTLETINFHYRSLSLSNIHLSWMSQDNVQPEYTTLNVLIKPHRVVLVLALLQEARFGCACSSERGRGPSFGCPGLKKHGWDVVVLKGYPPLPSSLLFYFILRPPILTAMGCFQPITLKNATYFQKQQVMQFCKDDFTKESHFGYSSTADSSHDSVS